MTKVTIYLMNQNCQIILYTVINSIATQSGEKRGKGGERGRYIGWKGRNIKSYVNIKAYETTKGR